MPDKPEHEPKHDSSPPQEAAEGSQVIGGSQTASASESKAATPPAGEKQAKSRKRGRGWLIGIVILALVPAGWLLLPAETRQHLMALLPASTPSVSQSPMPATPEPAPREVAATPSAGEPAAPRPSVAPASQPAPEPGPAPAKSEEPSAPAASSEEVQALISEIHGLRDDLNALRNENAALRQSLRRQQELELRDRLRRIMDARTNLPAMADAWRDIALLPMLNEDDRQLALRMRAGAEKDMARIAEWRAQLEQLAARLPQWRGRDVIPQPKQPALAWVAGQFHLRRAPTMDQRAQARLRARLLRMAHALAVQDWPDDAAWRHLLMDIREQFGDQVELKLPAQLDETRQHIAAMRKAAADWLGRL